MFSVSGTISKKLPITGSFFEKYTLESSVKIIESFCDMNGRLYDPVVGRFLSPDPVVQDPSFTQSLNRYSYCLNNPLKYTDPSGEKWNWN
jgi:RHS repeat-associated protein